MSTGANVTIQPSQFPANVQRDLVESLRTRRVNHKFHYDSIKQTLKWLALHEAYSPSRTDAVCGEIYDRAFRMAAERVQGNAAHLVGLGCGGGQKEARLLEQLKQSGKALSYTPCDVSTAMVLVARDAALKILPAEACFPTVCDLATEPGLADLFSDRGATRLFTCFGVIPNFEPATLFSKLGEALCEGEWLLLSANLAPGADYLEGVRKILPQYDNPLTREWLLTFLLDLGVEREDGEIRFEIGTDDSDSGLRRVVAQFHFSTRRSLRAGTETFQFDPGDSIRLFYSYRYTPPLLAAVAQKWGFELTDEWTAASGEEGVFLLKRR